MIDKPKFMLPENLNKLAKWLRVLGYDAMVVRKISMANMIRMANRDRRIILTRAHKFAYSPHRFRRHLIVSEDHLQQLEEILDLVDYNETELFTRCLECNRLLNSIEKSKIKQYVPYFIYENHDEFLYCRNCGKIYWPGTHYQNMKKKLEDIFKNGGKE